tara:strand:- start:54 stop:215 length:162 start_codon:yes stop_codon:yes gene_type:complete
MNWIKRLFRKKEQKQCAISVVVSSVTTDKCLCELNAEGQAISGWCSKHHTDWL